MTLRTSEVIKKSKEDIERGKDPAEMDIHAEFSGKKEGARIQFGHNGQSQEEKEKGKGHCHGRKEERN